jgi:hypothetical protein
MKCATIAVITLAGGLALATASAAQRGGGGGGGAGHAAMPAMPSAAPRSTGANPGGRQDNEARANRQGPENASPSGVANANEHAGLSSTTAADLSGLTTGLTVKDSTGATVGTISKIEKAGDGSVRNVLVAGANGKHTIRLAPSSLNLSGNVVTTTATPH